MKNISLFYSRKNKCGQTWLCHQVCSIADVLIATWNMCTNCNSAITLLLLTRGTVSAVLRLWLATPLVLLRTEISDLRSKTSGIQDSIPSRQCCWEDVKRRCEEKKTFHWTNVLFLSIYIWANDSLSLQGYPVFRVQSEDCVKAG